MESLWFFQRAGDADGILIAKPAIQQSPKHMRNAIQLPCRQHTFLFAANSRVPC